ncbi:MAG TPA: hypothetical protein VM692_15845 [Gammaproteobacteria bacterium]|nr:hypothetical protein [Gammaproteobacteria bacterium]
MTEHDIDSDGVITRFEAQAQTQALNVDADELLTEIRRGDLLSAIEKRETADSAYTATDYRRELDGLTDVEVIDLANLSGAAFEARRQANAQKFRSIHCWHQDRPDRSKSRITLRRCS